MSKAFIFGIGGKAQGGGEENDFAGLVDGTLTSFTMPEGKTSIAAYKFYQAGSLVNVELKNCEVIGNYAFYACRSIENLTIPNSVKSIGEYAFYQISWKSESPFELNLSNECSIGKYAFYNTPITHLSGTIGIIGDQAFCGCSSLAIVNINCKGVEEYAFNGLNALTSLKLNVNGAIKRCSFSNLYNVSVFEISPQSNINELGENVFAFLGGSRPNPEANIFNLDFRNSTFERIFSYSFSGTSSSNKNQYMKIIFPNTVLAIYGYAFRYSDHCNFYFLPNTPPTLYATTSWSNATNYNIFVPYNKVNAYRTATNWTAQSVYIKGFTEEETFTEGQELPLYNTEGYELTWYSDPTCTTQVTTVTNPNAMYYCVAGTEKVANIIKSITTTDCNVIISDGIKTYSAGEGVRTGTILTIAAVPTTAGWVPYIFKVNDVDFMSGDTFTMNEDLIITAVYYDGENIPVNPIFAENSWAIIRQKFREGTASQFWNVGDTKPVTLSDGRTYNIRIADMQSDRYALANGSGGSKGVLEFVECLNLNGTTGFSINPSQVTDNGITAYTAGGWASCTMKNTTLDVALWEMLPDDLKSAISEIKLTEYSYSSPSPRESTNKLFLPAETEIFVSAHNSAEGLQTDCVKYNQFDYYKAITTPDGNDCPERVKYAVDTTTARYWWLRSPLNGSSSDFCYIHSNGYYFRQNTITNGGTSPIFAI